MSDTPSTAGATNVVMNQRSADAPFLRENVHIQGDENPWKALGFDAAGLLGANSVSEMIEADPESARTALQLDESPYATIDTEAQFNTALGVGRSMVLRGEGTGGVIGLTTPKVVSGNFTTIKSDSGAVLEFTTALQDIPEWNLRRGITVHADDVTFQNFDLTAAHTDLATNNCFGLTLSEGAENHGHRMKVLDMRIYNWQRCVSKDGSNITTSHDDVLFDRCFIHTAGEMCMCLNFGFNRLVMRDSRVLTRLTWPIVGPATHNAVYGGTNWRDCLFHNCVFGNTSRHAFEATPANELDYVHERTRVVMCHAENCGDMAFSLGFCVGGIYDHCTVKNAVHAGFEVGGRVAGHPDALGNPSFFAQAILDSCEVDGVTRTVAGCCGFTLDGAGDTIVRGATKIRNITSDVAEGACGIGMVDCERVTVQGVLFEDCGHKFIYVDKLHLPTATGFHQISGNTFRNPAGYPPTQNHYAIWIRNQSASIRQNTAFQKTGTYLGYESTQSVGSLGVVTVDGVSVGGGVVTLAGSNETLAGNL